jgi:hypothetical protein
MVAHVLIGLGSASILYAGYAAERLGPNSENGKQRAQFDAQVERITPEIEALLDGDSRELR